MLKMTDRDPRRQRCLKGGVQLSDANSYSLEDVGGQHTYGSPVKVPLTGADSTSFMLTPWWTHTWDSPFRPEPGPRTQPRCWFTSIPCWRDLRGRRSEYGFLEHFWVIHAIQHKLDHQRAGKHATGLTIALVYSTLYSTPYSTSCCSTHSTMQSGASCAGYITVIWGAYIAVE